MAYVLTVLAGTLIIFKIWYKLTTGRCTSKQQMKGKTVIITGANSGIGKTTSLDLARRGARVILACRNPELGMEAAQEIRRITNNNEVVFKRLDLSKQNSIRKFAEEINREEPRLDVLINNAGMGGSTLKILTEDGIDVTFAINYFGPFLLTNLLLDKLKESAPSRIINVSSILHKRGNLMIDDINEDYHFSPSTAYGDTKLALNIFSKLLADKLSNSGVTSNSLHPGVVNTAIFRNEPKFIYHFFKAALWLFCKTPEEGAQTTLHLAISEEVEGITGKYFSDCKIASENILCADKHLAVRLWSLSEKLTKLV